MDMKKIMLALLIAALVAQPAFAVSLSEDVFSQQGEDVFTLLTETNNVGYPAYFEAEVPIGATYHIDFGDGKHIIRDSTGTGIESISHWYMDANYKGYQAKINIVDPSVGYDITSYSVEVPVWIPGDTNGDGKVNDVDFNNVRKAIRKSGTGHGTYKDGADLNNDGKVNVIDLIIVVTNMGNSI